MAIDYLRPTGSFPETRVDTKKFEDDDEQKKSIIRQSLGMLTAWGKTRPTARLYEGSVFNDEHKVKVLGKRRAKNKVARRSRRVNRRS